MNILLLLIPISLVLVGLAIAAFAWAVKRGQFDDLDTPALDVLHDDANDSQRPDGSGGAGKPTPDETDAAGRAARPQPDAD